MRVLFTTQPETGHWHPLVPLARALRDAGHDIAFATTPATCARITANGFRCFAVGADATAAELEAQEQRLAPLSDRERTAAFWADIFAGVRAARSLPDLLTVCRSWRPEIVVREYLEFAGCVAAERLGLPHAAVQISAWRPWLHSGLVDSLDRLRQSIGLEPDPLLAMPYRYLLLATSPPSFVEPGNPLPSTAHVLRPIAFDQSGEERLPAWVEHLGTQPTIYATLGTGVNTVAGVFEAILDALRDEPITLVMTTGRDRDPAEFGPQPPNVHIERYIPQSLLFPYCDLVVTHGGRGTVMAVLAHGLPMAIVPIAADQPDNARRCAQLGVAQVVNPQDRTPAAIGTAVREVLADPRYRDNARKVMHEIQTMPGPEHGVAVLERLAVEPRPLLVSEFRSEY